MPLTSLKRRTFNIIVSVRPIILLTFIFANNLILFCRDDEGLVLLLKNTLRNFYHQMSLKANPSKSNMDILGVSIEEKNRLIGMLRFEEGKIPFKYLRVPITYCKLLVRIASCSQIRFFVGWLLRRAIICYTLEDLS